jgi:arylsulfatase A-like enzyme
MMGAAAAAISMLATAMPPMLINPTTPNERDVKPEVTKAPPETEGAEAGFGFSGAVAPKPNIIAVLQDDLGWGDVRFNHGLVKSPLPEIFESSRMSEGRELRKEYAARVHEASPYLHKLAKQGVLFERHYVHYHCSPSRRSFLTGRLPLHVGEQLSTTPSDDIDLRMTSIGTKLKEAGYLTYYIGKGHTGFMSMKHLPLNQGFDKFIGFLGGEQSYTSHFRWQGNEPHMDEEYSTTLFRDHALKSIKYHDKTKPMFMFLPWQSVHGPYDPVPENVLRELGSRKCETTSGPCTYLNMLAAADEALHKIVLLLEAENMWENTLMLYTSDNGGTNQGINYPLRGEKETNWEGGVRAASFITGGFVPSHIRGTTSKLVMHMADWYPTFCHLAGIPSSDHAALSWRGSGPSVPDIDGKDVWPYLADPQKHSAPDSVHQYLWVSSQVLIKGDLKLIVAQPKQELLGCWDEKHHFIPNNGWRRPEEDGDWLMEEELHKAFGSSLASRAASCSTPESNHPTPCLFNVAEDPSELQNLASHHSSTVVDMWRLLMKLNKGAFLAASPPEMLGNCDPSCAIKHWKSIFKVEPYGGPVCGVPACAKGASWTATAMANWSATGADMMDPVLTAVNEPSEKAALSFLKAKKAFRRATKAYAKSFAKSFAGTLSFDHEALVPALVNLTGVRPAKAAAAQRFGVLLP